MPSTAESALALATLISLLGFVVVVLVGRRARRVIGTPVCLHRSPRRARWRLPVFGLGTALLAVAAWIDPVLVQGAALPVLAAVALAWLQPWELDEGIGQDGLQRGWLARGYGDLDEWRLTGEHLRFRLGREWSAVRVPPEHRAALRERLTGLVPDRESSYS